MSIIIFRERSPGFYEYILTKCTHCNGWIIPKRSLPEGEKESNAVCELTGLTSTDIEMIDGFQKYFISKSCDKGTAKTKMFCLAKLVNNDATLTLECNWFGTVPRIDGLGEKLNIHENTMNILDTAEQFLIKMAKSKDSNRKLIIVRHGERIDRIFPGWMKLAWFSKHCCYKPFDLNVPACLPKRRNHTHYSKDSPLTEVGYFEAQSVGRSLQSLHLHVDHIYSSPAFRCVQTATGILKTSIHNEIKIKIEPGLFEFFGWYPRLPEWFTVDELIQNGYHIDSLYDPIIPVPDLLSRYTKESHETFYERCEEVIREILDKHNDRHCNIVVVAHGPHLDATVRPLLNRSFDVPVRRFEDFGSLFPFCSFIALEEIDDCWTLITHRFPHFTYTNFTNKVTCEEFFDRI